MAQKVVRLPVVDGLGHTLRKDNWWKRPGTSLILYPDPIVSHVPKRTKELAERLVFN